MRVQLAVLSAFLFVTALLSGVNAKCAADASLEVTHEANLNGVVYIEKLIINSQWNFSFTEGDTLNISFAGSDSGSVSGSWSADNTTLTATFAIAAGGNTPSDGIVYTPRPRRQIVSSASSNVVGLNTIITLVTGLLFARSNKKGLIMLAVAFLMLSVTMETTMAQTVECPSATITATIPRGLVRRICNADETECQCGPGFSGANCDPEVEVPVAAPVATPVATPVSTPVAAPVTSPVAAPVTAPVAAPVTAPVAAPVTAPVAAPVTAPVAAPVTAPVAAPVTAPVAAPVAAPVTAPVTAPVAAPVTAPVAAPVTAPVAAPVDVPVATPVTTPVDVPVATPVAAPVATPVATPVDVPVAAAPVDVPAVAPVDPTPTGK